MVGIHWPIEYYDASKVQPRSSLNVFEMANFAYLEYLRITFLNFSSIRAQEYKVNKPCCDENKEINKVANAKGRSWTIN